MTSKLDDLAASARASSFAWSDDRAARVLGTMLVHREQRVRRQRAVRRFLAGASGVATVLVLLLRGASATPATAGSSEAPVLAESHSSDGGYARD
jgi:hypothetical protein